MPAHDASSFLCDRCGRHHGYDGCPGARVGPYATGPHPTGPAPGYGGPGYGGPGYGGPGPGWSTGQRRAVAPTLHSGPHPTYRAPGTGPQPTYGPPSGQEPAYRAPSTGQQPAYRARSTGQRPAYRARSTGQQAAYRAPTGPRAVYRGPSTGPQPAYRAPAGDQQSSPRGLAGQQPASRVPGPEQQPSISSSARPQPAFRSPSVDPAVRPGGFVQPTYPSPSSRHEALARSGRAPALPPSLLPSSPGPGPSASPLDWTGQLGGWSAGVAKVPLDTTGAGEADLWSDRTDDRPSQAPHDRPDTGSFPRAQHTGHLWPSVTTDPFGLSTQAAVRAERRERSRTASFGFQLHVHTPRRARRHTVEFAEYWGLDELVETAELVVSELMTNALEASLPGLDRQGVSMAVAPLELRLSAEGRQLRIEIRDHNPDPPVLEEPDVDDERGRGLLLVDSYCDVWGYHRLPTGGKVVWCLIGPPGDA